MFFSNEAEGSDPVRFLDKVYPHAIGKNIKRIRMARNMSQEELGAQVGLSANRIQQYECGFRKPKNDLIEGFAYVLGVNTLALRDPFYWNDESAMFIFFKMEREEGLKVYKDKDGALYLKFANGKNGKINSCLEDWYKKSTDINNRWFMASTKEERDAISQEYEDWKWRFPKDIMEEQKRRLDSIKVDIIKQQIEDLQDELDKLENRTDEE